MEKQSNVEQTEEYKQLKSVLTSALRENKYQLELLNCHNIVSATDDTSRIISANERFTQISGYTINELLGKKHRLVKSNYHSKTFFQEMWKTIYQGKCWQGIICNRHKNGSLYWVDATIIAFLDAKGKPEKYVSICTDITKTKESEKRLKDSQKLAKVGTFDLNIHTDMLYWPKHLWLICQPMNEQTEIAYEDFLNFVHPDDQLKVKDAKLNCIENNIDYQVEHRIVLPDGQHRWIKSLGSLKVDHNGVPNRIMGVSFDITKRRQLEFAHLRAYKVQDTLGKILHLTLEYISLKETLQQIIEIIIETSLISTKSVGAIFLVDESDNTLILEAQTGLHPSLLKQCAKLDFGICHCGKAAETQMIQFSNCLDQHHEITYEGMQGHGHYCVPIMLRKKLLGVLNIYLEAGHQPSEDEREFLLMLGDTLAVVIDRKYAIRSMIEAKKEADFANRAKSEFLANMSHELRTPLNAILGYGQLLQMESTANLTDSQEENVSVLIQAGQHLLKLINEVLDLAKIEAGQIDISIESIILADIIAESLQLISPQAKSRNINVILTHKGSDISKEELLEYRLCMQADGIRLKQVLLNILSNAVKYNRLNGKLTLDCQTNSDGMIRISITDTGKGLSKKQQKELFKPFKMLHEDKSEEPSTGIGLVITKNLIELMNGKIGFESHQGEGSTFWFELPTAPFPKDIKIIDKVIPVRSDDLTKGYTVLYIDDNPVNLKLVSQILNSLDNIHILTADEPMRGLELATAQLPDLILLDIHLPDISGYDVLRHLQQRQLTRNIPVIALSANTMPRDIKKALKAGFIDYICKPFNIESMKKSIQIQIKTMKDKNDY